VAVVKWTLGVKSKQMKSRPKLLRFWRQFGN